MALEEDWGSASELDLVLLEEKFRDHKCRRDLSSDDHLCLHKISIANVELYNIAHQHEDITIINISNWLIHD